MGPTGCPETLVINDHYALRNSPEERSSNGYFSQIHTQHINTLCGQNVEIQNVKLAVHIVTTGL